MKTLLKRSLLTLTALFAFLGMGTVGALATGILTWDGHDAYLNVKANLATLDGLLTEKESTIADLERKQKDKEKKIAELDATIAAQTATLAGQEAALTDAQAAIDANTAALATAADENALATAEMKDLEKDSNDIVTKHQ